MRFVIAAVLLAASIAADAQERQIFRREVIPGPIEEVWKAWTTPEGIKTFLAPDAKVDLRPGGAYELVLDPSAPEGQRGTEGMTVMGMVPRSMLSFTWNGPPTLPAETRKHRTLVVVRFNAVNDGETMVTLVNTGWGSSKEWDAFYIASSRFWPTAVRSLMKRFDEGPVNWEQRLKAQKEAASAPKQ